MVEPNLRALRAFAAVMRFNTISEAARRLHISQPALSRLVQGLEQDVGITLFRRERQRIVPTEAARRFVGEVERVLNAHADLPAIAREFALGHDASLKIAASPRLAYGVVGPAVNACLEERPGAKFSIEIRFRFEIERWVASRRYDIGLASVPVQHEGVLVEPFAETDACVVLAADDPLAGAGSVSVADLAGRKLIATPPGSVYRERTRRLFEDSGVTFAPSVEVSSVTLGVQYAALGIGYIVADAIGAAGAQGRVALVPLEGAFRQGVAFVLPKNREEAPILQQFKAAVRDAAARCSARPLG